MSPDQLAAIRARRDAATPGPWRKDHTDATTISALGHFIGETLRDADAEFVAHARQDVDDLLDYVDELSIALGIARRRLSPCTADPSGFHLSWEVTGERPGAVVITCACGQTIDAIR